MGFCAFLGMALMASKNLKHLLPPLFQAEIHAKQPFHILYLFQQPCRRVGVVMVETGEILTASEKFRLCDQEQSPFLCYRENTFYA
jgi:hypothetical protein